MTNYLDDMMLIRLDEQEVASTIEDISEMKNKPMKIQYSATLANLCEGSNDNICPSIIRVNLLSLESSTMNAEAQSLISLFRLWRQNIPYI